MTLVPNNLQGEMFTIQEVILAACWKMVWKADLGFHFFAIQMYFTKVNLGCFLGDFPTDSIPWDENHQGFHPAFGRIFSNQPP